MRMDMPLPHQTEMKIEMEMELWFSPDVLGYSELEAFYKRNMSRFPWSAMIPGTNAGMRATVADLQKKMAAMHGAPVLEIVRTKMGARAYRNIPQQQTQRDKLKAQLEAMRKQGAAGAAETLARMNALSSTRARDQKGIQRLLRRAHSGFGICYSGGLSPDGEVATRDGK